MYIEGGEAKAVKLHYWEFSPIGCVIRILSRMRLGWASWRTGVAFLAFLGFLAASISAQAERRVALVIGNGDYDDVADLINPRNDAREMAVALRRLGFSVHEGFDLDRTAMFNTLNAFSRDLPGADLALFFYAGHAVQVDQRNYLIPTDASVIHETDLQVQAAYLALSLRGM